MSKHKLSKTVLEMKFMKKTKIEQEKKDAETDNIDILTDHKIQGGHNSNYVIERNWEFIEGLKCARFNFGMSQKPPPEVPLPAVAEENKDDEPPAKRAKRKRFN
ncbi:CLUMA_CG012879, isoform A [Clunio marinus]|uniref:CLUMA_CG012879, isoform A n=1 Tax=Clunio marinus TaxID=568069 RepID=A0A1J1IJ44_9DIPT|nr:CLUMA_CG012879, isoform A [Clunio marinus]